MMFIMLVREIPFLKDESDIDNPDLLIKFKTY